MVDRREIKACMARNGMTLKDLAEKLGISLSGLIPKMQGKRDFTEKEISSLHELFGRDILLLP